MVSKLGKSVLGNPSVGYRGPSQSRMALLAGIPDSDISSAFGNKKFRTIGKLMKKMREQGVLTTQTELEARLVNLGYRPRTITFHGKQDKVIFPPLGGARRTSPQPTILTTLTTPQTTPQTAPQTAQPTPQTKSNVEELAKIEKTKIEEGAPVEIIKPEVKKAITKETLSSDVRERYSGYFLENIDWMDYKLSGSKRTGLELLNLAYDNDRMPTMIVGPAGSGKSQLVRKFAEMKGLPLFEITFDRDTSEAKMLGTFVQREGKTEFIPGPVQQSMETGGILYLNELNSGEDDVITRLNEVLDFENKRLTVPQTGQVVKAKPTWFVVSTVNPSSGIGMERGTKELPTRLATRFHVNFWFDYPSRDIEKQIVLKKLMSDTGKTAISTKVQGDLDEGLEVITRLREQFKKGELPIAPSIRQSYAYGKLLMAGVPAKEAFDMAVVYTAAPYGLETVGTIKDMAASIGQAR